MEQIYPLFCYIACSLFLNVQCNQQFKNEKFKNFLRKNEQFKKGRRKMFKDSLRKKMNSLRKDAGRYSRTTRCFSRIKDITNWQQIQGQFLALKDVWQP